MCPKDTYQAVSRGFLLLAIAACLGSAQQTGPDWRKIGSTAIELSLASPVTGPVESVWFSADGGTLYARTAAGRTFETNNSETWKLSTVTQKPISTEFAVAIRAPFAGAKTVTAGERMYALGAHLYQSDDGGRTWANLTGFQRESVIGSGQHDLAVSPRDPEQLVVANDYGVWRSFDGGLSWAGLNQSLPNLMARRILSTPNGAAGVRISVDRIGPVETLSGGRDWLRVVDPAVDEESRLRQLFPATPGVEITAIQRGGELIYAGAADGRIWVSFDRGGSWSPSREAGGGPVNGFFVDPGRPSTALAALGGSGAHVLRTTNSGIFWDDLSANLPNAAAHGITASSGDGAVYVATSQGIFFTRADIDNSGTSAWMRISDNLPNAPAFDVKLSPSGDQVYVSLEGYGIYAGAAPHRARSLRIVNAADFTSRAAAPGSLLSVLGSRVISAKGDSLEFPVLAASESASQVQVPFEVTRGNVTLALETSSASGTTRFRLALPVQPVAPAIFVSTEGEPMILDADSGLMLDARNTGKSNSRIQILATGLGKVRPEWPTGLAAPLANPPAVAVRVRAFLDRVPVEVTRSVLAPGYIGFYLVELQLPPVVNAGPAELYLEAEGQESNRVRIFLEP